MMPPRMAELFYDVDVSRDDKGHKHVAIKGKTLHMRVITQEVFDAYMEETIRLCSELGTEPEEVALLELQWKGGKCPVCGKVAELVVENLRRLQISWYDPACGCLEHKVVEAERRSSAARLLEESGLPSIYRGCTFGSWDQSVEQDLSTAMMKAYSWVKQESPRGLLLHGNIGTGKTFIAAACMEYYMERGKSSVFLSAASLTELVIFHSDVLDWRFEQAELVVLDDFDKTRYDSDFNRENVFRFFERVIGAGKRFIITTNISPPEKLGNRFDQAIVSRIIGNSEIAEFKGKDYRLVRRMRELRNGNGRKEI